jgi:TolB-like protein/DNA-binding SARP family transcriptional activator
MSRLTLSLLGGFEAAMEGSGPFALSSRKGRALLTWLAMNGDRPVGRDAAMGLLWGGSSQKQASASLNQTIYELRQCLGPCGHEVLRTDKESIELARDRTEVDALEFSRLARSSDMADIAKAERLYRGDLLAGFAAPTPEFEDWIETERRRLRAEAIQALTTLVARQAEHDEAAEAISTAYRLAELDPYSEPAHRALMIHFASTGQLGLSNDVYETFRNRLLEDLDTKPSDQTERLRDQIFKRELGWKGEAAAADEALATARPSQPTRRKTPSPRFGLLLALMAFLAAGLTFWWSSRPDMKPVDPATMMNPLPAKPSIAVLAFDDLSTGADREYLSDAISEGIITELSRFPGLFVIARNSSFHYRGGNADVREIARELGVRYILEGSQQKAGDRLRVTVQLIDAVGGNHVWAETYDRDLTNIFAVQDEIVHSVAATLGDKLIAIAGEEAKRHDPANLRAFELWLKGTRYWQEYTREGLEKARQAYLEAVAADPELARGYAGLAFVYWRGAQRGWMNINRGEALAEARRYAKKALSLAPNDWVPHSAMGYILLEDGDRDGAIASFREALRLNPNTAIARASLAEALLFAGNVPEAIDLLHQAMRLDPHHPDWMEWDLAWAQWYVGDCRGGLATMARMASIPIFAQRTKAPLHVCLGQIAEAHADIEELLEQEPDYSISLMRKRYAHKFRKSADLERWIAALREAGLPK